MVKDWYSRKRFFAFLPFLSFSLFFALSPVSITKPSNRYDLWLSYEVINQIRIHIYGEFTNRSFKRNSQLIDPPTINLLNFNISVSIITNTAGTWPTAIICIDIYSFYESINSNFFCSMFEVHAKTPLNWMHFNRWRSMIDKHARNQVSHRGGEVEDGRYDLKWS